MPLFTSYFQELNKALDAGDSTEHTHRPALKELLQSFSDRVTATNEPKRSAAGMPDFDIKIERRHGSLSTGKVEAKDVGIGLKKIIADAQLERPRSREGQQLKRYLSAFPNLILTNHLDFHWFTKGEEKLAASLGALKEGLVEVTSTGVDSVSKPHERIPKSRTSKDSVCQTSGTGNGKYRSYHSRCPYIFHRG